MHFDTHLIVWNNLCAWHLSLCQKFNFATNLQPLMRELALNILDVAENSLRAKATKIQIDVEVADDTIRITVADNGRGMSEEFLSRVADPFTTTRTTRKVGLGLPLIKMEAEMSGGSFGITSEVGVGTTVTTTFGRNHIDRPPMGNLAETLVALLPDLGETRLIFSYRAFGKCFTLDTEEVKQQLDGVPIDAPDILVFLRDMTEENIATINGGIVL